MPWQLVPYWRTARGVTVASTLRVFTSIAIRRP
ncbi:MAG: hypothetical protein ACJAUC_003961, partial [Planctomycetota bacterium]